jgi:hypothetical protein
VYKSWPCARRFTIFRRCVIFSQGLRRQRRFPHVSPTLILHKQSFLYHSAVLSKRIMPFYGLVPEQKHLTPLLPLTPLLLLSETLPSVNTLRPAPADTVALRCSTRPPPRTLGMAHSSRRSSVFRDTTHLRMSVGKASGKQPSGRACTSIPLPIRA